MIELCWHSDDNILHLQCESIHDSEALLHYKSAHRLTNSYNIKLYIIYFTM